jgi:hypothetical protein
MPGFRYRETLHGGFYLLDRPTDERAADFLADVMVPDVTVFARSRTPTATLKGPLTIEGFAADPDVDGRLVLDLEQKRAVYEVTFHAPDRGSLRLRGHKELELLNLVDSFTLLSASVYDEGAHEVGRAVLRFDARGNLGHLLRSFRLMW